MGRLRPLGAQKDPGELANLRQQAVLSFATELETIRGPIRPGFSEIRPIDTPGFIVAQFLGAFAATFLFRWLVPSLPSEAKEVVLPHVPAGGG